MIIDDTHHSQDNVSITAMHMHRKVHYLSSSCRSALMKKCTAVEDIDH